MAKQIIRLFFFIIPVLINAQDSFTIHGKIERSSKSNSIVLGSSWGTFTGEIKNDGSFVITGKGIKDAGDALIYTDSSRANSIWLEPGEYYIECKEVKFGMSLHPIFRIPKLKGPKDAEISHGYKEQFFELNSVAPEERKQITQNFVIKYIDSVFKYFPSSKTLPNLLRYSSSLLDDEALQIYYSFLSDELKTQHDGEHLANYFKRKEKIEKEKYFQDFEMKDQNGKIFKLSSLNKKLILLDFWASWCGPCRKKHPRLIDIYKKYADKGFEIISISLDDNKRDWVKAITKDNLTWINVSELKGWESPLAKNYFIKSIPFRIWLDKDKKIISLSDLTEDEIKKYLY